MIGPLDNPTVWAVPLVLRVISKYSLSFTDNTWYWRNSSDCQINFRANHFVDKTLSKTIFSKYINFQTRHCKKTSLYLKQIVDQRLEAFHQQFSWVQLNPWNIRLTKCFLCKDMWQCEWYPECQGTSGRCSFKDKFFETPKPFFSETFVILSMKLSCIYNLLLEHRLTAFFQQFSCTSVGPSKCAIEEMIGSQDHPKSEHFPKY